MERTPVTSSNLVSVGYNEESCVLEVEFKGGVIYEYLDVPKQVHEELMSASSHGEYMNAHVRTKYRYQRI